MTKNCLILCLLITSLCSPALACSCVGEQDIRILAKNTPLIFRGKVIDIKNVQTDSYMRQVRTTFEILELLKGDLETDQVTLRHSIEGSMCGVDFTDWDDQALILAYADYRSNDYSTDLCTLIPALENPPQFVIDMKKALN